MAPRKAELVLLSSLILSKFKEVFNTDSSTLRTKNISRVTAHFSPCIIIYTSIMEDKSACIDRPVMESQPGLEWVRPSFWAPEPRWTKEPDMNVVAKTAYCLLGLSAADVENATIEFINSGAFNKLYRITCSCGTFAMRVTLPVDPRFKTSSEAAVLDIVSKYTSSPVPKVIALDNSHDNEIGFEWMLMDFMPGTGLKDVWETITWSAKCKLVERIVEITADLFRVQCNSIGNIYRSADLPETSARPAENGLPPGYVLDRIVSMAFFWENHITLDIPRGPFHSSSGWLSAILAHKKYDSDLALATQDEPDNDSDADDEDEDEVTQILIERLLQTIPKIFPPTEIANERFALHHDDMHQENLMVDAFGELTALVDWECVSVVPMWKVCQLPSLLAGRERSDEPQPENYSRNDDGELDEGYGEHLEEYNLTRLRELFFERMEIVEPKWMAEIRASEVKADFGWAVENCDTPFCRGRIREWLENVIAGVEQPALRYTMIQK